jgi:predicted regulator of Ras-like GTPase activity (Roadblock/LC7/MglB family)
VSLLEGIPQLVVFEEEHSALRSALARTHADSRARAVLLIDTNGQLLADHGDTEGLDITAFASLTASNIAATASMARLVGEKDFTILFHQGEKDSIHISLVGQRSILAVIFGKEASLGIVRLRVRKAAVEIEEILRRVLRRMSLRDRLDLNPLCEITDKDIEDLFSF